MKQVWRDTAGGQLAFSPDASSGTGVVDELDLLLTSGRLSSHTKQIISSWYDTKTSTSSAAEALQVRFSLKRPSIRTHGRPEYVMRWTGCSAAGNCFPELPFNCHQSADLHTSPAYCAYTFFQPGLQGGCSAVPVRRRRQVLFGPYPHWNLTAPCTVFGSFNMLVPKAGCSGVQLNEEYTAIRGTAAVASSDLLSIAVPTATQPCDEFGLHPSMQYIQEAYTAGEAAFVANIGAMVEPVTKEVRKLACMHYC